MYIEKQLFESFIEPQRTWEEEDFLSHDYNTQNGGYTENNGSGWIHNEIAYSNEFAPQGTHIYYTHQLNLFLKEYKFQV